MVEKQGNKTIKICGHTSVKIKHFGTGLKKEDLPEILRPKMIIAFYAKCLKYG